MGVNGPVGAEHEEPHEGPPAATQPIKVERAQRAGPSGRAASAGSELIRNLGLDQLRQERE